MNSFVLDFQEMKKTQLSLVGGNCRSNSRKITKFPLWRYDKFKYNYYCKKFTSSISFSAYRFSRPTIDCSCTDYWSINRITCISHHRSAFIENWKGENGKYLNCNCLPWLFSFQLSLFSPSTTRYKRTIMGHISNNRRSYLFPTDLRFIHFIGYIFLNIKSHLSNVPMSKSPLLFIID